jgi:hypothetical protein
MQVRVLEREDELSAEKSWPVLVPGWAPERDNRRRVRRLMAGVFVVAGLVVLGTLLYVASNHAAPGNSDGATVILEGKALSGGNLTLKNWALSLDSFWLVDVPLYAVAVLLAGVRPQLLHLVPTLVALGVICLGAWIARFGRRGWAAVLAGGAVVILLGLPTRELAANFLMGPLHVTTVLWCLMAFVALHRGRYGWSWLLALSLLAFGMLGDLQAAVLGVVPVCLAGIMRSLRTRTWSAGAPAVTAGIGSVAVAEALRHLSFVAGTFSVAGANPRASLHQMALNFRGLFGFGASLGGVAIKPFNSYPQSAVLQVVHAIGVAVVFAAVVLAVAAALRSALGGLRLAARRLWGRPSSESPRAEITQLASGASGMWFGDVLLFGFLGACAIYVSLTLVSSSVYDRYLTSVVIFGSILAARLVGRVTERVETPRMRAGLLAAVSLVGVGYVASFATSLTTQPPVQASTALVSYLEVHHLDLGIGDYWSSSIATVESSEAVQVRPVTTDPANGYLRRYNRQVTSAWYGGGFQFFVYNTALPWQSVDAQSAAASFGPPVHVASVGTYRVLTWGHDISVPVNGGYVRYEAARGD